ADPGAARGATVLAGHVDWGGRTGPFAALWDLGRGTRVTVVDDGATRRAYRVVETLTLHKDDLAAHAKRLFGGDRPHRLVLVTCGGDVSGGDGYTDNRIVVAEPADGG
ncbi:class F sortase, partial [Saccharomonospora halophila]|uniref:class F sortase n=1 Tax=Saccharomonospora halophila TaxID=129922 RepID=UPI00036D2B04